MCVTRSDLDFTDLQFPSTTSIWSMAVSERASWHSLGATRVKHLRNICFVCCALVSWPIHLRSCVAPCSFVLHLCATLSIMWPAHVEGLGGCLSPCCTIESVTRLGQATAPTLSHMHLCVYLQELRPDTPICAPKQCIICVVDGCCLRWHVPCHSEW